MKGKEAKKSEKTISTLQTHEICRLLSFLSKKDLLILFKQIKSEVSNSKETQKIYKSLSFVYFELLRPKPKFM